MNHKLGGRRQKALRQHSTLDDHLERQIRYLKRSCKTFDEGHEDEAPRIAVVLRVLLHDTSQSRSLLSQLNIKSTLNFVDTGLYRDDLNRGYDEYVEKANIGQKIASFSPGEAGLVVEGLNPSGNPAWIAPLATPRLPPLHPATKFTVGVTKTFDPWWTTPIVETGNMEYFSREDLVKIMANQDGGAHVDPELDVAYEALTVDDLGVGVEFGVEKPTTMRDDIPSLEGDVAAASVRQIAYELLKTLLPKEDHSGPVRRIPYSRPIVMTKK